MSEETRPIHIPGITPPPAPRRTSNPPPAPKTSGSWPRVGETLRNITHIAQTRSKSVPADMFWRVTAIVHDEESGGTAIVAHPWGEPESEMTINQETYINKFRK